MDLINLGVFGMVGVVGVVGARMLYH